MGCDIHVFIEYSRKPEIEKSTDRRFWDNFGAHFNPGRDYQMFALLAGVRGTYDKSREPKGRLEYNELGYRTQDYIYRYIVDEIDEGETEKYVLREKVESWVKYGAVISCDHWISDPDLHSHSWMTLKELEEVFEDYLPLSRLEWGAEASISIEWQAIASAMRILEDGGKNDVRIVFCFDN
jgi:hypothetical protein